MYVQLLRQSKARQLRLRTAPLFFQREKEELPQAGFRPCHVLHVRLHVHVLCPVARNHCRNGHCQNDCGGSIQEYNKAVVF